MTILSIGGDARGIYCLGRLALERGFNVYGDSPDSAFNPDGEPRCDILLLPYTPVQGKLVVTRAGENIALSDALRCVSDGGAVFSGRLDKKYVDTLAERGVMAYNWFDDETLTVANAALTAEGAAQIITKCSDNGVSGSDILILGWGRVAKACADLFGRMGSAVSVAARREAALAEAYSLGYETAGFIDFEKIEDADVVVNTVPETVFTEREISKMKGGSFILELASKPYGVDFDAAERLGIKAIIAPGVPGKYTPEEAGRQLALSVLRRIEKGGGIGG